MLLGGFDVPRGTPAAFERPHVSTRAAETASTRGAGDVAGDWVALSMLSISGAPNPGAFAIERQW
jgi:hypothetical protein